MPNNILDPLRNQEGGLGWSEPAYTRTIQVPSAPWEQTVLLKRACVRVEEEEIHSKAQIPACSSDMSEDLFSQTEADFCVV